MVTLDASNLSNLNDWLTADGVFHHSLYNFFKQILKNKEMVCCLFRGFFTVNGDVGRPVDNRHDRSDGIQNTP